MKTFRTKDPNLVEDDSHMLDVTTDDRKVKVNSFVYGTKKQYSVNNNKI